MNKFISAIKTLDITRVEEILQKEPKWLAWSEDTGKNALHYLCGVDVTNDAKKEAKSLEILLLLLKNGMDINSVHQIKDNCDFFLARPLWYAYTRGRNKTLYTWLLNNGANPDNCMFAITWYNDTEAAALFKKHGADIDDNSIGETPFMGAFNWRRFDIAAWFLNNGADVNATDKHGNTALYYAVKKKYDNQQIELLLKHGADADKANNNGISPRMLAEQNRQRKILSLFK
jgi:ankyrin repeat protein